MTRKVIFTGLVVLLFLFKAVSTDKEVSRRVICLVDFSGTITEQDRKGYASVIADAVLPYLQHSDQLKVLPIDAGAVRRREVLFEYSPKNLKLERKGDPWSGAAALRRQRLLDTLPTFAKTLAVALLQNDRQERYGRATNIFGALRQLRSEESQSGKSPSVLNRLWGQTDERQNIALLFSDMIHDADGIDLSDSRTDLGALLQSPAMQKQIPQLENWTFFVYGIRGDNLSNEHFEKIRQFWSDWFAQSRGELMAMDFDNERKIEAFFKGE